MGAFLYWSDLVYAPNVSDAWFLSFYFGGQESFPKRIPLSALAMRSGDVTAAVPEPETAALILIGLGALAVARRRRKLA